MRRVRTASNRLFTNCTVIDGRGGEPIADAHVLVSGDSIRRVAIGPFNGAASGAEVWDLQGGFLLPGFCSTHVHLGDVWPLPELVDEPAAQRAIRAGSNAMDALRCGITSMRSLGEDRFIDVAWREAFEKGTFIGPTIVASGNPLIAPGGHAKFMSRNLEVKGPGALRRAVEYQIERGVDCIKLVTTAGEALDEGQSFGQLQFTSEEVRAVVDTAHAAGKFVCTHTGTTEGVLQAVDAGVDCIEHGYVMNQTAVDALVANGVFLTPTLTVTHNEAYFEKVGMPAAQRERFRRLRDRHAESFRRAYRSGVQIVCGADLNPVGYCTLSEIEWMVRLGMTASDALVAATDTSARTNGIARERGTIEVGKKADLVVLNGNPLDDIGHIWNAELVVKSGRPVGTDRSESKADFWDVLLSCGQTGIEAGAK